MELLSPHPGNLIWMDILAQLSGSVSICEHPHHLIASIVQMSILPVHLSEAPIQQSICRIGNVCSVTPSAGEQKVRFWLVRDVCTLFMRAWWYLCFKARRSCDTLTVKSHNYLGRVVARFVIIFIGAWGLIGKWGQSNEAARHSGYLLYIPNQVPPSPDSLFVFSSNRHEFTRLVILFRQKLQKKTQTCNLKARWTEFHLRFTCLQIPDIRILSIYVISICVLFISPFQQSIPYGTSRPHNSVRIWDFHIWAYKNHFLADSMQKKRKNQNTDTSQSLACNSSLLVSVD